MPDIQYKQENGRESTHLTPSLNLSWLDGQAAYRRISEYLWKPVRAKADFHGALDTNIEHPLERCGKKMCYLLDRLPPQTRSPHCRFTTAP
jgi:hypothetical protein